MIERMMMTTTPVTTFHGSKPLALSTGFFFQNAERLYLITNQHTLHKKVNDHRPDRLEFGVHVQSGHGLRTATVSVLLVADDGRCWRSGYDRHGEIDIAAIELEPSQMPPGVRMNCFTPEDIAEAPAKVGAGDPVLIVHFPAGHQDEATALPVVRHAVVATSMEGRFRGQSYFLTDTRAHSGSSGAPVVVRRSWDTAAAANSGGWMLLGVHSSTFDLVEPHEPHHMASQDMSCNWYADILPLLTTGEML
ncbi:MAG: hypothetical protein RLZZ182_992 [Pseudomonadota bacterium]|jgi:hypothetical protein